MDESRRNGNGLGEQWASPQASEYTLLEFLTHMLLSLFPV